MHTEFSVDETEGIGCGNERWDWRNWLKPDHIGPWVCQEVWSLSYRNGKPSGFLKHVISRKEGCFRKRTGGIQPGQERTRGWRQGDGFASKFWGRDNLTNKTKRLHNTGKGITPSIPAPHSLMTAPWKFYLKFWCFNSHNPCGTCSLRSTVLMTLKKYE